MTDVLTQVEANGRTGTFVHQRLEFVSGQVSALDGSVAQVSRQVLDGVGHLNRELFTGVTASHTAQLETLRAEHAAQLQTVRAENAALLKQCLATSTGDKFLELMVAETAECREAAERIVQFCQTLGAKTA